MAHGKTEKEIEEAVVAIYADVNQHFKVDNKRKKVMFAYNDFLHGIMNRSLSNTTLRKLSPKQVQKVVEQPLENYDELQRQAIYFYLTVQEFKNVIDYKSNMLTYSHVVRVRDADRFDKKDFIKNLTFAKDYNIASKFGIVTKYLLRDDVYFGYEMSDNSKHYIWKKLPNEYCRLVGKDEFGVWEYEFNFGFFQSYPEALSAYPPEFATIYNAIKEGKKTPWQQLNSKRAFAFKFDESINKPVPYFLGLFIDLARLMDIKDVDLAASISDNYKLIHQEVPINKESGREDDFLISGEFMEEFHSNLRANTPKDVGVATTPMKVTALTLKSGVGSSEENIVTRNVSNILGASGTSRILMNGDSQSSLGLNKNIQVDENNLFKLLRQYELFMNKRLFLYNNNSYKYWLSFLDHTYFNTEDLFNRLLKMGQFGFNTEFEVASVCNIQQIDFLNNAIVKEKLDLSSKAIPFKSAHIGDVSTGEVGGEKKESDLTDEGARSRGRDL